MQCGMVGMYVERVFWMMHECCLRDVVDGGVGWSVCEAHGAPALECISTTTCIDAAGVCADARG